MNTWIAGKDLMKSYSLIKKKAFYSSLNIKGITCIDYRDAKRVYKEFNNKNISDYYDLCVQS